MRATFLVLGVLGAVNCVSAGQGDRAASRTLVIVDVNVIPMDSEHVLSGHAVIVRDGLIAAVGPAAALSIPVGAHRVEGHGRYLLPGLTDAHVHIRDESELRSYLAHGVTTVVHLSGPSGNVGSVYALRARVAAGDLPGPSVYTSGRIIDGEPAIFPGVSTVVRAPGEAAAEVHRQLEAGADLVKVYNNLRTDALRAVAASAHASGATVWGHVPRIDGRATALQRALDAGLDVIAHGEEVFFTELYSSVEEQVDSGLAPSASDAALARAVRLIKNSGATVISNLSFVAMTRRQLDSLESVFADPEARYLHPMTLRTWREQNPTRRRDVARFDVRERGKQAVVRGLTRALAAAGVPLLLGTDATAPGMFPGKSAHLELEEFVAAGLTPFQALATGTVNPGAFFRTRHRADPPFGLVRVGYRADLVLLDQNPLSDIRNIANVVGVIAHGHWYTRSGIDSLRSSITAASR